MNTRPPRARVTVEPHRLRSLRLSLGATRWVLYAVALAGVAATARNAIESPRERVVVERGSRPPDAAAQWFALRFTRAYLTWSGDLDGRETALAPFVTPAGDPDVGLTPASGSTEQVRWLAVADERQTADGEEDFTVAAGTATNAVRYLAVAVARGANGAETLVRYPSLVAAPVPGRAATLDGGPLAAVNEPAVVEVLDRALRNYIDSSSENLAADLAPGAMVEPAATGLELRTVERLVVEPSGAVLATVVASDPGGDAFTLAYEISLRRLAGRWEITQIES